MLITAVSTTLILQAIRTIFTEDYPNLGALLVPYSGPHYDENVAACDARIKYVSGFTGSAGSVIITPNEALLWTDGRYHLQAEMQLDENWTLMKDGNLGVPSQSGWLLENLNSTVDVYADPKTMTKDAWDRMSTELKTKGIALLPTSENANIVDRVWSDDDENPQPKCPQDPIIDLPEAFSGRNVSDKLREIRSSMANEGADALLVSELDEIAWLFNLRGSDFDRAAIFLSFAIIKPDEFQLFINNPNNLNETIKNRLESLGGSVVIYSDATAALGLLAASTSVSKIWLSKYVNAEMANRVPPEKQFLKLSPVMLPKAIKNDVEVAGMKAAHLRDSAAIVAFFSWLDLRVNTDNWNNITEISAAEVLRDIRSRGENFVDESFSAIAGFGSNGAIIHYRADANTNTNINNSALFLLDSGGLYKDGTTDITRTIHLGTPTNIEKDRYTRVLKGHIAIATAKIPEKLPGYRLDTIARKALWDVGLDYQHGTGHGIGHYLNVHEGPHRISYGVSVDDPGLQVNMFTSNEPGYYEPGEFGIRIENIVRVIPSELPGFLEIETVSFVPFESKLIDQTLLTQDEIEWIDWYHEECKTRLTAFFNDDSANYIEDKESVLEWLEAATKTLEQVKNDDNSAHILNNSFSVIVITFFTIFYRILF